MDYFHRVSVVANPANYKIINWTLKTTSGLPASIDFFIDKARSGGDWQEIAGPLTDTCHYVDTVKWNWNKDKNTFYRVRFNLNEEGWQLSTPAQAVGKWSRSDYLKAKEICRREYLLMRVAGEEGELLKRKEWGTRCSCVDYDTEEVVSSKCPKCLGTGIIGGYYAPITLPALAEPHGKQTSFTQTGLKQQEDKVIRVVAYPLISTNDIWINVNSNERWQVRQVVAVAEVRGLPIVQKLALKLLPQTDIIYSKEGNAKALEIPEEQPTGNEYGWDTADTANCINDFDY